MKNDLINQTTEYDCGPTNLMNAMRYLFEREEIPPVLLKRIWSMGLDDFSEAGELGKGGTSKASMRYMAEWLECFAKKCGFPIHAAFFDEAQADLTPGGPIWQRVEQGGCAVVRVSHHGSGHYVLMTTLLPDGRVGLYDPYYEEPGPFDPDREFIYDHPKAYNRAVRPEILNLRDDTHTAMGPFSKRELLLLWRSDQ